MIEPTPEEVKAVRLAAGLSADEAADKLYIHRASYYRYENSAKSGARMLPAMFELFKHKLGIEKIPFKKKVSK